MKKIALSILGILTGIIVLSLIIEVFELLLVMNLSGKTMEELQANQSLYFSIRNQLWFLIIKVLLSIVVSIISGRLCVLIARGTQKVSLAILAAIQFLSIIFGALFSNMKDTTPFIIWMILCVVIPMSILFGGYYTLKKKNAWVNLHK